MTPVVIASSSGACFGMYHSGTGPAVLICPPFGEEALRTARVWRDLAVRLGRHGVASLRFDLPGTGNSAGAATDPDRVGAWRAAIHACADWLAERHDGRVFLLGHRFGALLALDAVACGVTTERLVLLDPPTSGAALARYLRARARMTGTGPMPEGPDYIQAGTIPLSAETMAAITTLPASLAGRRVPPALLVTDGSSGTRDTWAERLGDQGSAVETIAFTGYDEFVHRDAFRAEAPTAVMDHVVDYLLRGAVTPMPQHAPPLQTARLALDNAEEVPVAFGPAGRLFGILCRPDAPAVGRRMLLLPTMGADPCSGMSRMWTELARRLALQGIASFRFDMAGIGESEGDHGGELFAAMYHPDRVNDLRSAIDAMEVRGFRTVNIAAYCAGAYTAWQAAAIDNRICAILVSNLAYLSLQPSLTKQALEERPGASRVGSPDNRVFKLLPQGSIAAIRQLDDRTRRVIPRRLRLMFRGMASEPRQVRRHVETILARGCSVSLVMSDDDHGHVRLRHAYGEVPRFPTGVELTVIAGADHQFTERHHRAQLLDIATAFALREVPRAAASTAPLHPTRLLETV